MLSNATCYNCPEESASVLPTGQGYATHDEVRLQSVHDNRGCFDLIAKGAVKNPLVRRSCRHSADKGSVYRARQVHLVQNNPTARRGTCRSRHSANRCSARGGSRSSIKRYSDAIASV